MSDKTGIEWTDATWSPLRARVKTDAAEIAKAKGYTSLVHIAEKMAGHVGPHCEHCSPGCCFCYSGTNNSRCLPSNGTGLPFTRQARDLVEPFVDEKILAQPLRWKRGRRIFVENQSDLFGEWVPDEQIDRAFAVMALCPQHTFQVLTKRSKRMREYFSNASGFPRWERVYDRAYLLSAKWPMTRLPSGWPLKQLWLGVSVEDQQRADERIPDLLATPAAVRFLSCEPLLGPIDIRSYLGCQFVGGSLDHFPEICDRCGRHYEVHGNIIDQAIIGGESGPGARPCNVAWIRDIVRQCRDVGVAAFVKQCGSFSVIEPCRQHHYDFGEAIGRKARFSALDKMHPSTGNWRVHFADRKGGDMEEWPEDLRIREFPR